MDGFLKFKNGVKLSLKTPLVMGIVNITPDSFYDGGRYFATASAFARAEELTSEGADIIDLGAASTKPGSKDAGAGKELKRLAPVLEAILNKQPDAVISIDTFHASVAREMVNMGASIINDISGGVLDSNMFKTIAELNVPYVLTHIQGTPQTMQTNPAYEDVLNEVRVYFEKRILMLKKEGAEQIIIDPGFGFGKSLEHNFTLLRHLDKFTSFGLPVLAGLSRKSMINKALHVNPENALTGTIALNTIALMKGANILRVHDVKDAKQVVALFNLIK